MNNYIVDFGSWIILSMIIGTFIHSVICSILATRNKIKFGFDKDFEEFSAIHPSVKDYYTKDVLVKALEYTRVKSFFNSLCKTINGPIKRWCLVLGLMPFALHLLNEWSITTNEPLCVKLIILAFLGSFVELFIDVPLELYDDAIEKHYGYSNLTLKTFVTDTIKSFAIGLVMASVGFILFDLVLKWLGTLTFAKAAILFAIFIVCGIVFNYAYVYVIQPLFNKYKHLEDGELKTKISDLVKHYGYKLDNVYVVDESTRCNKGNAYCMSLIGGVKRIVIYDTLIKQLTTDEIVAVFAHELAHAKKHHNLINEIMEYAGKALFIAIAVWFINDVNFYHAFGFRYVDSSNIEQYRLIGFMLTSTFVKSIFWVWEPIDAIISRKMEYQADAYAVKYMKSGQALITGLLKLHANDGADPIPDKLYAAYNYSHPALPERIRAIQSSETDV